MRILILFPLLATAALPTFAAPRARADSQMLAAPISQSQTAQGTNGIVTQDGVASPVGAQIADTLNTNKVLKPLEYQNPIATEPMRDPQISRFGDTYWMTATSWSFFEQQGQNPGVKIWSSKDLKRWDFRTMAVLPNFSGWDAARFWAPELHFINGKYWLTYNAMSVAGKTTQYIGLAVADDPKGPYRKITVDAPLCPGNDAHLFQDDDGKVYLFRSGISASEIDLENCKLVGDFFPVIAKGDKGQWDGGDGVGIEGPYVIKRDGTYYMFYSSWGRGYEVGIATAKNIRGPWTKAANNPFYGAQKIENTQRYGTQYTQAPDVPWTEVGHGSPFEGPDGKLWIASHGYKKGDKIWDAKLVVDPLHFENGIFRTQTPTWTPQSVEMPTAKP